MVIHFYFSDSKKAIPPADFYTFKTNLSQNCGYLRRMSNIPETQ
jgi:hypothetical protein